MKLRTGAGGQYIAVAFLTVLEWTDPGAPATLSGSNLRVRFREITRNHIHRRTSRVAGPEDADLNQREDYVYI